MPILSNEKCPKCGCYTLHPIYNPFSNIAYMCYNKGCNYKS